MIIRIDYRIIYSRVYRLNVRSFEVFSGKKTRDFFAFNTLFFRENEKHGKVILPKTTRSSVVNPQARPWKKI